MSAHLCLQINHNIKLREVVAVVVSVEFICYVWHLETYIVLGSADVLLSFNTIRFSAMCVVPMMLILQYLFHPQYSRPAKKDVAASAT